MRGVYTASYEITALAASKTLMYLEVPADLCMEILSAEVSNSSIETNEQIECTFQAITTLGTPTATTVTPAKHETGDVASSVVAKANVTASEPTYTANTEIGRAGAPTLSSWRFEPTPEERPVYSPNADVGLRLLSPATPAAFDCVVRVTYREIGG